MSVEAATEFGLSHDEFVELLYGGKPIFVGKSGLS